MFPEIPEKLSGLGVAELRALAAELRKAAETVLADTENLTPELFEQAKGALASRKAIFAEIERQRLAAEAADDSADEEPEPEPEASDTPDEGETDEGTGEAADEGETDEGELPAAGTPKVRTKTGVATTTEQGKRVDVGIFKAKDGIPSKRVGETFENWGELAVSLAEVSESLRTNTDAKYVVAQARGQFDESMIMDESPLFNLHMFEQEEMVAAMCAPLPPVYDLACFNTNRRPVRGSLPTYRAPRGGVSIYPSPTLEDITTGVGVWDADDDADPEAVKEACQTIPCATPVDYRIYGVYRCLTVKNLLAMTFPELVEAYLNRLAAAHARLAETLLLEAMATTADTVTGQTLGYNATTSIIYNILNYLAHYQELQRWDAGPMEAWMPRWVLYAIKADLIARRRTDGGRTTVASDAEIAAMFRDAGVNPHFFMDTPSWATPIPDFEVAGQLGLFTRNLEILLAPAGKYALMDRGELNIGVTGNNLYRDNASNAANEFTFFFENFEGIVDTNSCPAHLLSIDNLCWNGIQIADDAIDCEGNQGLIGS